MKILSLGTDKSVLNINSNLTKRVIEYGQLVDKYSVVVPAGREEKINLSPTITIYSVSGNNKITSFFRLYKKAKSLIKNDSFDVITSQDAYFIGLLAIILGNKFNKGVEIQIHGWEKFNFFRRNLARFVLARADSIRVVSPRIKNQLVYDFGVDDSKITVVSVFVDINNKEISRHPKGNKNTIFLTVGRFVPVKNISLQIQAMFEVVKKYPGTELWIVGDGPERESIEQQIKNLGLTRNVKLLGWQSNLERYYTEADIFLLTSNSEGWPLVILEAASYGLPIIMTDVGSAGYLIINNESGIVIPVGDKDKLVEGMIRLIEDEVLRLKFSNNVKIALKSLPTKEQILILYKQSWGKALK